ncbi:hypothetical protein N9M66_04235 [Litoreibacter sp.]|nr:hypothetical protein [Litoreibacter sp.]
MDWLSVLVAPALALFGGLIGIVGDTWDSARKGWRKLRPTGALAAVVILISGLIAVNEGISSQRKTLAVRDIAYREIRRGWAQLSVPFHQALWSLEGAQPEFSTTMFDEFSSMELLKKYDAIEFDDMPPVRKFESWARVICEPTHTGMSLLLEKSALYTDAIPAIMVNTIHDLSISEGVRIFRTAAPCGEVSLERGFEGYWGQANILDYAQKLRFLGHQLDEVPLRRLILPETP